MNSNHDEKKLQILSPLHPAMVENEELENSASGDWSEGRLKSLVERMLPTYNDGRGLNQAECHNLPSIKNLYSILDRLTEVLFPGYKGLFTVTRANLATHVGNLINRIYYDLVIEVERAMRYYCRMNQCDSCHVSGDSKEIVASFLDELPEIREILLQDVKAAMDGDPAARGYDDVILAYPCIEAITTYRLAHILYKKRVPLIPRIWTERAHSRTGIDINPGATIGPRFFIDHGTGVVIGETCIIGEKVAIYQGVTLGALAPAKGQKLAGVKRHPTIEDNVIIYSGATILGGDTVIGKGSMIGGNVWITRSVPPYTKVLMPRTDLIFVGKGEKVTGDEPLVENGKDHKHPVPKKEAG